MLTSWLPRTSACSSASVRHARQVHRPLGLSLLATTLLVGGLVLHVLLTLSSPHVPVYTVAMLRAHLRQHPAAWMNRTVTVRAQPGFCSAGADTRGGVSGVAAGIWSRSSGIAVAADPVCADALPGLVDPGLVTPARSASFLPLVPDMAPPVLTFLRQVPLIGRLVPPPQALTWGRPALYRIVLRRIACVRPQERLCVAAALVDGTPAPL